MTGLTFSQAIELAKEGKNITRAAWGNSNIMVYLDKGSHDFNPKENEPAAPVTNIAAIPAELFEMGAEGTTTRFPNFNLYTGDIHPGELGSTMTGWVPTQVDMLAVDWSAIGLEGF